MAFGDSVQSGSVTSEASGALTISISSATAGNLLVAVTLGAGGAASTPTGYTLVASIYNATNDDSLAINYKIAAGGETTIPIEQSFASYPLLGVGWEIAGPFEAAPQDTDETSTVGIATRTTTNTGATPTTADPDSVLVAGISQVTASDTTGTWSTGYGDTVNEGSAGYSLRGAFRVVTSTGAYDAELASHASSGTCGVLGAFKGAPVAGAGIVIIQNYYRQQD